MCMWQKDGFNHYLSFCDIYLRVVTVLVTNLINTDPNSGSASQPEEHTKSSIWKSYAKTCHAPSLPKMFKMFSDVATTSENMCSKEGKTSRTHKFPRLYTFSFQMHHHIFPKCTTVLWRVKWPGISWWYHSARWDKADLSLQWLPTGVQFLPTNSSSLMRIYIKMIVSYDLCTWGAHTRT